MVTRQSAELDCLRGEVVSLGQALHKHAVVFAEVQTLRNEVAALRADAPSLQAADNTKLCRLLS